MALGVQVTPGDADADAVEFDPGGAFPPKRGLVDGLAGEADVDNLPFVETSRLGGAESQDVHLGFAV